MSGPASIHYQQRWRLADEKGKSIAEGFTSIAKAKQWAKEKGLDVKPYRGRK